MHAYPSLYEVLVAFDDTTTGRDMVTPNANVKCAYQIYLVMTVGLVRGFLSLLVHGG